MLGVSSLDALEALEFVLFEGDVVAGFLLDARQVADLVGGAEVDVEWGATGLDFKDFVAFFSVGVEQLEALEGVLWHLNFDGADARDAESGLAGAFEEQACARHGVQDDRAFAAMTTKTREFVDGKLREFARRGLFRCWGDGLFGEARGRKMPVLRGGDGPVWCGRCAQGEVLCVAFCSGVNVSFPSVVSGFLFGVGLSCASSEADRWGLCVGGGVLWCDVFVCVWTLCEG